ncbi:MAG TPA: hypothetical protein VKR54_01905 [Candidatus Babeliales bacterium]|nr:hypothetical protein [Candidatus Babeliales bacterium]
MKNIKNMLLSIVSLVAFFGSQSTVAGTSGLLKSMQGPGLEIYNKSTNAITVTIFMNGTFTQKADISPNQKFAKDIDTKQSLQIGIYDPKTTISTGTFSREITPAPKYFYEINASGKTKYLSWNPTKSTPLYPQTGTFMGLSGKSDSGYPLSDNISQGQIVKK